jgi:hypothetical protein
MVADARTLGDGWLADYLRLYGAVLIVWVLGLFLLYLRLVLKSVDISGHMAWSFVLLSQVLVLSTRTQTSTVR